MSRKRKIQIEKLKELAPTHTTKQLSEYFDTCVGTIRHNLSSLGIKSKRPVSILTRDYDVKTLSENASKKGFSEAGKSIGVTKQRISQILKHHGYVMVWIKEEEYKSLGYGSEVPGNL